ncbi:CMRF35-like molecule 5 [Microcaecilia unicolor]|uniref:CMRF35-like molecule 5 n=1 Tax=Microcaecilia unicolor TaxID=1415580 RepID=A0A6P7ZHJ5_9AMPH|nr:CMRF35-like molecule 5 [Microcaecilia unicolor]
MKGLVLFLLQLWIPGSQLYSNFYAVRGTLGETIFVHCKHVPEYQNHVHSWCRQINEGECETVVDTSGLNNSGYEGRTTMSFTNDKKRLTNITVRQLQEWDTGLYWWRVWTGYTYQVVEKIQLLVEGLNPTTGAQVVRGVLGGTATLHCFYTETEDWSKLWCKQRTRDNCNWLFHSDGKIIHYYEKRAAVFDDQKNGRMTVTLRDLRAWDAGLYKCEKLDRSRILNTILLLISEDSSPVTGAVTQSERPSPTICSTKYLPNTDFLQHTNSSQIDPTASSYTRSQYQVWDILRWISFLVMITCLIWVKCGKKNFSRR